MKYLLVLVLTTSAYAAEFKDLTPQQMYQYGQTIQNIGTQIVESFEEIQLLQRQLEKQKILNPDPEVEETVKKMVQNLFNYIVKLGMSLPEIQDEKTDPPVTDLHDSASATDSDEGSDNPGTGGIRESTPDKSKRSEGDDSDEESDSSSDGSDIEG